MQVTGHIICFLLLQTLILAHPNGSRGPPSHSKGKPARPNRPSGRPLVCAADQFVQTVNGQEECQCSNTDAMFYRVVWPTDSKCYSLNSQGPCKSGEWITLDNDQPICKSTSCTVDGLHIEVNLANGSNECGKLGERGTCPVGHILERSGTEVFCVMNTARPLGPGGPISVTSIGIAPTRCGPNERLAPNGICKPLF